MPKKVPWQWFVYRFGHTRWHFSAFLPFHRNENTMGNLSKSAGAPEAPALTISFPRKADPNPTILLVEDELIIRMNAADFLLDRGFVVLEASNAIEALAYLTSCVVEIDLVFTDVRMPGKMDGLALARWLQQHRTGLPVIVTSGDVGRENLSNKMFPADCFFPKPYELNTIAETIAKLTRSAAA